MPPARAREFGGCLPRIDFRPPRRPPPPPPASAKANGWRRSVTRWHSSDLCLVFLLHLESRDRRAVMRAEGGGIGKGARAGPGTAFRLTSQPTPRSLPLLLSRFPMNCFQVSCRVSRVDFRAVVEFEKRERHTHHFQSLDFYFKRGIISSVLSAGICGRADYARARVHTFVTSW